VIFRNVTKCHKTSHFFKSLVQRYVCLLCLDLARNNSHTYLNEACHTHINEVCHTYQWVVVAVSISHVTHINVSCHKLINESYHKYQRVMSYMSMSHVTRMNKSCHTYQWDMTHIPVRYGIHINESCHTYHWVMSHIRMSHVRPISPGSRENQSCHACRWVMSNTSMSYDTYINESCLMGSYHTYQWVMAHISIGHWENTGGVSVGLSTEWWDSWNGCSSTKSLLSSWKRGTYRGILEDKSIQILDSFYIDSLKLKRSNR